MHDLSQWPASGGERLLQDHSGSTERANRFYNEQMVDVLTQRMREFLATQTWMILCTADEHGMPSGSPRFGEPGFASHWAMKASFHENGNVHGHFWRVLFRIHPQIGSAGCTKHRLK